MELKCVARVSLVVPPASEEQQRALETFQAGSNLVVRAVAGAGKTTLMLQICRANPSKYTQIVTYNAALKNEGRLKIKQLGLHAHVRVDTFHSLAGRAYGSTIRNDQALISLLECITSSSPAACSKPIDKWYRKVEVLMIDEAQDITPVLWQLLMCVIRDITQPCTATATALVNAVSCMPSSSSVELCGVGGSPGSPGSPRPIDTSALQLVVVGDERQMINGYRNADARYLSLAPFIFPSSSRIWSSLCLSTSYRLTPATAAFVNTVMLGESVIVGGNEASVSLPVMYWPMWKSDISAMIREVEHHVATGSTVAFLSQSTKCSPFAQELVKLMGCTAFFIASDNATRVASNPGLLHNKIPILTFHAAKGLEFDYVYQIVATTKYNKGDVDTCGNVEYVASTRARKQLVLVEYRAGKRVSSYPRLLKTYSSWHPDFIIARGRENCTPIEVAEPPPNSLSGDGNILYCPSTITDFMASEMQTDLMKSYVTVREERAATDECVRVCAEQSFSFGEGGGAITENVAFLYGLVIPMVVELKRDGRLGLVQSNREWLDSPLGLLKFPRGTIVRDESTKRDRVLAELLQASRGGVIHMAPEKINASLFYLANVCNASMTLYPHLLRQILNYDWIEHDIVKSGVSYLENEILGGCNVGESSGLFEHALEYHGVSRVLKPGACPCVPIISGAADYVIGVRTNSVALDPKWGSELELEVELESMPHLPVEHATSNLRVDRFSMDFESNLAQRLTCDTGMSVTYEPANSARAKTVVVYEFKFTPTLEVEHILQTAIYVAMQSLAITNAAYANAATAPCGRLFNIRTGQLLQVRVANPRAFLEAFITAKLTSGSVLTSNPDFIAACERYHFVGTGTETENVDDMDVYYGDVSSDAESTVDLNVERRQPVFFNTF